MLAVAVIDVGKTNIKVALVDLETRTEVSVRRMPNTVRSDGLFPHFDEERLWGFILSSLGDLQHEANIEAIVATTHGATAALLNAAGQLALPILDYEFDGPDSVRPDYERIRPGFAESGSPPLPGGLNLGAQLYWQSVTFPERFAAVTTILPYPQYWGYRLTGVVATEATSLGCHTDLWAPHRRNFSSMVEASGWTRLMPPLKRASDRLGEVLPDIAARIGIDARTPVHVGIHDSNASLLPHLLSRPAPFSVLSTGTWVIALAVGGNAVELDPNRDTLINVNALGDPVPSARFMGGREFSMITADNAGAASDDDVAAVLRKKIMLLPSVQPACGPFPHATAEWTPVAPTAPGEQIAAASLYLAMMASTCLQLVGAQGPTLVEGPFARNDTFVAMLEAATGRVAEASVTGTGTSIGAALLTSTRQRAYAEGPVRLRQPSSTWLDYAAAWREAVRNR